MIETSVSENVRRIISDKGLKQRAVAARAGFSEQQFSSLLNNRRVIKDIDVIAIAKALNVTPNDLFGLDNRAD